MRKETVGDLQNGTLPKTIRGKHRCNLCAAVFETELEENNHMVFHFGMGVNIMFLSPRPSTKFQENKTKSNESVKECEMMSVQFNESLKCVNCSFYFRTTEDFERHQCVHFKKRTRCSMCKSKHPKKVCKKCNLTFPSIDKLVEHTLSMHKYNCNLCPKSFKDKRTLIKHRYNHSAQEVVCPICSQKCVSKFNLTVHLDNHIKELSVFKCQVCQEIKPNSKVLSNHIMLHHVEVSPGGDNSNSALPVTRTTNTEVSEENNSKSTVSSVRSCSIRVEKLQVNYCPICSRGFLEITSLKLHIFRDHIKSLKKTLCEICKKTVSCAKELTCHIMSHIKPSNTRNATVQIGQYDMLNKALSRNRNRAEESLTKTDGPSDVNTNLADTSGREVVCDGAKTSKNTSSDNSDGDCKENIILDNLDRAFKENVLSNDSENPYKIVLLEDTDYSEDEAFMCPCSELFETMEDLRNHSLSHI
ncbi:hypothetical protein J6590_010914 [Homalodisca vitripennis]|nr:hypothetical protein J6590_010914 [Homalodisca vitripennis]